MASTEGPTGHPQLPPETKLPESFEKLAKGLDSPAEKKLKALRPSSPPVSLQSFKDLIGRVHTFVKEVLEGIKTKLGFATKTLGTAVKQPPQTPRVSFADRDDIHAFPRKQVLDILKDHHIELTQDQQKLLSQLMFALTEKYPADSTKRTGEMYAEVEKRFPGEDTQQVRSLITSSLEILWGMPRTEPSSARPSESTITPPLPTIPRNVFESPVKSEDNPPRPPTGILASPEQIQAKTEQRKARILGMMTPSPAAKAMNTKLEFERKMADDLYTISSQLLKLSKEGAITPDEGTRIHAAFVAIYGQFPGELKTFDDVTAKVNEEVGKILGDPEVDSPKGQVLKALANEMAAHVEQPRKMPRLG